MQTISLNDLQQNLGLYLKKVKDGDEIIIEETGEAIARILPFDTENEEARLVAEGLMRLPKRDLPNNFWDEDAPEISTEEIVKAIRSERDED